MVAAVQHHVIGLSMVALHLARVTSRCSTQCRAEAETLHHLPFSLRRGTMRLRQLELPPGAGRLVPDRLPHDRDAERGR